MSYKYHLSLFDALCHLKLVFLYFLSETRPEANYSSDQVFLVAKFRLKLKKLWKTTRPFRYNLNQIPYYYTLEVTNRFKGLDLTDRVPEKLQTEVHDIVQEAVSKTIPKKNKCKKAKWLSEEALQIAEKEREAKGKGQKERYTQIECRVPKNSKGR